MLERDEFNVGRVGDPVPNNVFRILVLEPAAVCVVPTKVRVEGITHGTDVAPTGYLPGENQLTGHFETSRCVIAKTSKMLGLLIAGRHCTCRRLAGFEARRG